MAGIDEKTLLKIAEAIGDDENLSGLGLNLGFKKAKVSQYVKTNRVDGEVGFKGTSNMLFDWKKKTPRAEQLSSIRKALKDSNLTDLLDDPDLFPQQEGATGPAAGASQSTTAAGTPSGATASPSATPNRDPVTDGYLNDIVVDFPHTLFSKICEKLGWGENQAQNELTKHKDYQKAYRSALQAWKNRDARTKQQLFDLLRDAGYTIPH